MQFCNCYRLRIILVYLLIPNYSGLVTRYTYRNHLSYVIRQLHFLACHKQHLVHDAHGADQCYKSMLDEGFLPDQAVSCTNKAVPAKRDGLVTLCLNLKSILSSIKLLLRVNACFRVLDH